LANVKIVKFTVISTIKSNTKKIFFFLKIYHDVVVHVHNFQLSAKSSSFFGAFFLHFYGVLFLWTPYIYSFLLSFFLSTYSSNFI